MTQFPIPFVDTILEFVIKLVLPAIFNPFSEYSYKGKGENTIFESRGE